MAQTTAVKTEFDEKQERIQVLLTQQGLDALLLHKVSSFAWATCGVASYINTAATQGEASLFITREQRYLITNNIEAPRLEQEQGLAGQNWTFCISGWQENGNALDKLRNGMKVGADVSMPGAMDLSRLIVGLRAALTPEEGERFRTLGRLCAQAMSAAARSVKPGQTEYEIAARLAQEAECRGVQAVVNLIATDERIFNFRHPLPTSKKLERYAMLILCGRQHGLICSVTRFIHFGRLPEELRTKARHVAEVDAAIINATRPGRSLGDVFQKAIEAYAQAGYPGEWQRHHQGGLAGYEPREVTATPASREVVSLGQAFAWNPSIIGTKSEDTILVGKEGNEVLTAMPGWPCLTIEQEGRQLDRPAILEIA